MKFRLLALSVACAGVAHATLTNASFESPVQSLGGYTFGGIDGWSKSPGESGVWHIPSSFFFEANAPDGLQIGYSNAALVAQQSTDVVQVGKTKLTVMGGRRSDGFAGSFTLRLWAGGTVTNGDLIGANLLGETAFDYTQFNPGTFSLVTIEYEALDGNVNLGKLLTVQFAKGVGSQMNFDDVRLTTPNPVPEPTTMAALGAGLLALARRRKV